MLQATHRLGDREAPLGGRELAPDPARGVVGLELRRLEHQVPAVRHRALERLRDLQREGGREGGHRDAQGLLQPGMEACVEARSGSVHGLISRLMPKRIAA